MKTMEISSLTKRLRNQPVTAVRFIRAVKYIFAEHDTVPHSVEPRQISAIQRDILQPLLGTTERNEVSISKYFIKNLLNSMAGLRILELHPWLLSSIYTFAYFVISRRDKDNICMEAYNCLLKGETPTSEAVRHVINDIILNYVDLTFADDDNHKALAAHEIANFRKTLQRSCCKNELQILATWPEGLGLLYSTIELCNKEDEMRCFFKIFEINVSKAYKLNDSENKDMVEKTLQKPSTINFPEKPIEINYFSKDAISVSKNASKKITGLPPEINLSAASSNKNCSREDANEKADFLSNDSDTKFPLKCSCEKSNYSSNINRRLNASNNEVSCSRIIPFEEKTLQKPIYGGLERPIEINNSFNTGTGTNSVISNKIDKVIRQKRNNVDISMKDPSKTASNISHNVNASCSSRISSSKEEVLKIKKSAKKKSNSNTSNNISYVNCDNVASRYQKIQHFPGNYSKSKHKSKKAKLANRPSTITDLINSKTHSKALTSSIRSNEVDKVRKEVGNKIQNISVNENKIVESVTDSIFNKNTKLTFNKNGTPKINLIVSNKIPNRNPEIAFQDIQIPELAFQDAKEHIYVSSNDVDTNLVSSKCTNGKSSSSNCAKKSKNLKLKKTIVKPKRNRRKTESYLTYLKRCFSNLTYTKMNAHLKKDRMANMESTCVMTSKSITPSTVISKEKRDNHNGVINHFSHISANKNTLQADHFSVQPQDSQIKKEIFHSSKSNSLAMDSPILNAITSSNFTAKDNYSDSPSKTASATVLDLDFESCMMNSKTMNQQPQEASLVKKKCHNSRFNNPVMDFPIPVATARDSAFERASITVVDLDFEPCIVNSENQNQQPQQIPQNIKRKYFDSSSNSKMSKVNPVDQTTQPHIQQYSLQYQQQPCLLASSCGFDNNNTLFSNVNNGTPKFQSNVHRPSNVTNECYNYLDQAGSLSPYLSSSTSTVSNRPSTIQLLERNKVHSAFQENFLWPISSTKMLTNHQFPRNQNNDKYSNICKVQPREMTEVRISPLQQSNFQLNERRYPSHSNDVQNCSLTDITPTVCNCLQSQHQQQLMRYVFNNSTAAVTRHAANDHLTPAPNVWQAPVNSDKFFYICDYCPIHLKFESKELFFKHMTDAHNHACMFCKRLYPSFQELLQHIDEHTRNTSKEQEIAVHNELCRLAFMFKSE